MRRLTLAFLAMGLSCSISQILLVRELLAIFYGNEFILGLIFSNWLLGIALGSWLLGRLSDKLRGVRWLAFTFSLISIVLPLQIIFTRSLSWWLIPVRGEMMSPLSAFYLSFLTLIPFCSLHGLQFALGCRVLAGELEGKGSSIGVVYVLDALGAVFGGLTFTYLLVHNLNIMEVCTVLGLLNLLTAGLILDSQPSPSSRFIRFMILASIIIGAYGILQGAPRRMDEASYRWLWRGLDLVHYENSPYGNIGVTRCGDQTDFWINGLPFFTLPNPDLAYIEDIVHLPLLQHPSPERVLIIGEGLGGAIREMLKHPVGRLVYLELDPRIVELSRRFSGEASSVLMDPRVEVIHSDGRLYSKEASSLYDVIIVNLPPPSTLQLNRFYTLEFFNEVRRLLSVRGVLSVVLPSSQAYISEEMADRNRCIYNAMKMAFPSILALPGDYNIFLASPSGEEGPLTSDVEVLHERFMGRGLATRVVNRMYLEYKFSPERARIGLAYLSQGRAEVNRDARPVAVYHDLAFWNAMMHPTLRGLFTVIKGFDPRWLLLPLIISILILAVCRGKVRALHRPIYLAVITNGFAGMTFSIINLYSFQILCGCLYQEIGVMTSSFMLGLSIGGWYTGLNISRGGRGLSAVISAMIWIKVGIVIFSLILPLIMDHLISKAAQPIIILKAILPILNWASGLLVGLMFPLAGMVCLEGGCHIGRVAGALNASDLIGGCVGSLASSVWLIPLNGIQGACQVVAALNAASLLLLLGVIWGRGA